MGEGFGDGTAESIVRYMFGMSSVILRGVFGILVTTGLVAPVTAFLSPTGTGVGVRGSPKIGGLLEGWGGV